MMAEQIASLNTGSGYLTLDGNINNGSELFGPSSSQGFAELALFNENNNHFISAD
jgi:hypothetical protein